MCKIVSNRFNMELIKSLHIFNVFCLIMCWAMKRMNKTCLDPSLEWLRGSKGLRHLGGGEGVKCPWMWGGGQRSSDNFEVERGLKVLRHLGVDEGVKCSFECYDSEYPLVLKYYSCYPFTCIKFSYSMHHQVVPWVSGVRYSY